MSRNYQRGIVTAYDNSLSVNQSGAGLISSIRSANNWLKKNKVGTKIKGVSDALGMTKYIDSKTGGYYSKAAELASQKGYGRRKKRGRKCKCKH